MQKSERQNVILDVIAGRSVSRQDELAELLRERGFSVTQASISRDLDELGVMKVDGKYALIDLPDPRTSPFGIAAIDTAGDNLIVVRCASGLASAAAVQIDGERIEEIRGTLAGDDTIFVAVKDVASQKVAIKKLRSLFSR